MCSPPHSSPRWGEGDVVYRVVREPEECRHYILQISLARLAVGCAYADCLVARRISLERGRLCSVTLNTECGEELRERNKNSESVKSPRRLTKSFRAPMIRALAFIEL
jgi:hypothetical protein